MAEAAILNVALGKHRDDKAWGREMSRLLTELGNVEDSSNDLLGLYL